MLHIAEWYCSLDYFPSLPFATNFITKAIVRANKTCLVYTLLCPGCFCCGLLGPLVRGLRVFSAGTSFVTTVAGAEGATVFSTAASSVAPPLALLIASLRAALSLALLCAADSAIARSLSIGNSPKSKVQTLAEPAETRRTKLSPKSESD